MWGVIILEFEIILWFVCMIQWFRIKKGTFVRDFFFGNSDDFFLFFLWTFVLTFFFLN